MKSLKSQLKNLDILKELNLIHLQIDNMNVTHIVKVRRLNKVINTNYRPKNLKERFQIAVNEFRVKIDLERKMMENKIA